MSEPQNVSDHYLGQSGQRYYELFVPALIPGRTIQASLFAPFCGADKTVLDVGCSDGFFLRHLPAARRLGVEVNPAGREACDAISKETGVGIELFDSTDALPEAIADVAISNHVLEHVPEPLRALRKIRQSLKPGGVFVLITPFDDWREGRHSDWRPGDVNYHLYTWSPRNIGNLLHEAGFGVRSSRCQTLRWHPRLNWIQRAFGAGAFQLASRMLLRLLGRREVMTIADRDGGQG